MWYHFNSQLPVVFVPHCVVAQRAAFGASLLHRHDAVRQSARESQDNDEPAQGEQPQHPVRSFPRLQGSPFSHISFTADFSCLLIYSV